MRKNFEEITRSFSAFKVSMDGPEIFKNYIFWKCIKNKELQTLHEKILNAISKYHIRSNSNLNLEGKMKENFLKYGYPLSVSLYRPHITVTALKYEIDAEKAVAIAAKNLPKMEFEAHIFAMCLLSAAGEAVKIVKKVDV